ncbi:MULTISPECIES: alpha/beta hydrolase [unclassified Undibacterium]|uniref:alpha/beta fold hydrolase n=1 Tax=unclassified Undibacterium TaxID=2630295 RepID=UPI002AC9B40C|nr:MULTISPECIES: alpha/beta hydrolase [unclassified Undibacterium]MEB0139159.1 alpha/beta hydrolase [Undibacterium sp. CCC2.1]MEB0172861.1 alpha/beta hydrolase [Undibacterium sp. CCC1.1]MEB0176667.1 alpha/beta hydrolase [Undibacterium sp. CCC3.4]MEB0216005.1 alpha/beta hydrolase [Undibacterium sp. 5I2]WPX43154.1 alpha/beta hydrolase [Undibacterium sp. CCC3.4]
MTAAIQTDQYLTLDNGTRLHFASAGEKGRPLLLFVHGFPEFWYEWVAQLPEFGRDYYALAPDLRGFNLSDMPTDLAAYKARHIVDDLRLLILASGYQRAVIVAHDWGGAVCWNMAIALPQMVEKLIIINSPHPYLFTQALAQTGSQQAASEYMNWLRAEGSEQALANNDFALLDGFFNGMGQPAAAWFDAATKARYHACWARGLHGGVNYYRASPLHPPTAGQRGPLQLNLNRDDFQVRVPTRVIWGENDQALPVTLLDGLEEFVADLQVERIPEGSHWIIHEQPQRVNTLIRRFLSE